LIQQNFATSQGDIRTSGSHPPIHSSAAHLHKKVELQLAQAEVGGISARRIPALVLIKGMSMT
jgi:hypothetical protein